MAELVEDGVDGLHVPPGDAAALAETLRAAADDPSSGRGSPRRDGPASHTDFVDAHVALYQRLLERVPA